MDGLNSTQLDLLDIELQERFRASLQDHLNGFTSEPNPYIRMTMSLIGRASLQGDAEQWLEQLPSSLEHAQRFYTTDLINRAHRMTDRFYTNKRHLRRLAYASMADKPITTDGIGMVALILDRLPSA